MEINSTLARQLDKAKTKLLNEYQAIIEYQSKQIEELQSNLDTAHSLYIQLDNKCTTLKLELRQLKERV